jgi:hypothetical protein
MPVHPEFFKIGGRRRMEQPNYEFEAWIHPGGHTFRFEFDGATVTEVVVPEGHTLPDRGMLSTIACIGEKDVEEVFSDRITYVTSIQTESLSDHLYLGSYREMLEHADRTDGLLLDIPAKGGLPSLSLIEFQRYADQIHTQSYHLVGDGGLVLRTQSILQAGTKPVD